MAGVNLRDRSQFFFQTGQKKTLIPFLMAGYPSLLESEKLIAAVLASGVRCVEIGVPFSDPLADGPVIQMAASRALDHNVDLAQVLQMTERLKRQFAHAQLVLFTYLNPLLQYGLDRYAQDAKRAGAAATLTVDLPPEEAGHYLGAHQAADLKTVFLASPTTTPERLRAIDQASTGLVYYVSRVGITGEQSSVSSSLAQEIESVRKIVKNSLAVGFGISSPAQVAEVGAVADAVVVGSRLISLIEASETYDQAERQLRQFVEQSLVALSERSLV
jgi:tryptophan synthase alpha chain